MAGLIPRSTLLPDIEEYVEDGRYVLRAELPGFDPRKDVKILLRLLRPDGPVARRR